MVARCDGAALKPTRGSREGAASRGGGAGIAAYNQTMKPMPASSRRILTPVHMTASPVGTLPISDSWGQLLVYEMVSPGRKAADAQAVQKKKVESCRNRSGSLTVPRGIAYSGLPWLNIAAKCFWFAVKARARTGSIVSVFGAAS